MDAASRKEPFRYVMNQPIDCWLEVPTGSTGHGTGKRTAGVLIDLSRSGCKVRSSLNLRFTSGDTRIIIHFQLNETMLQFTGSVRWGWMYGLGEYQYGIRLVLTDEEEETLIRELDIWTMSSGGEGV
ncbi:PilZ domain-containing protein [Paenibacillus rhizophilus]|uniref:PilZ domain-containing protein n=1 Tax=Paenibacillus rhizophilus TaxID=1850366 RepID=A0A3N9Q4K8_9BACL|nr:PilZ domain-containing protein [Paenibacillus rhizophilus]RQW13682.1 PilZ domain-containing protein [Paenibacillus rhizophilus]